MIAITNYFIFITFVIGSVLAPNTWKNYREFMYTVLHRHNHYRRIHGAKELNLVPYLYKVAKQQMTKMTEDSNVYGSNEFSIPLINEVILTAALASKVVDEWYQTSEKYNYDIEPSTNTADPFTQIVWKDTSHLGVHVSVGHNAIYVKAVYNPPGNIKNQYRANVGRPQTDHDEGSTSGII